jgi:hypothetical protein
MEVNGSWVGWGLGDDSKVDFTVQKAKAYMRAMYRSYAGDLADTNLFDQQMQDAVTEMQNRLAASGALVWGQFILGVLDLPTEYAMGFKSKPLPIMFTVEGHSSNMFSGPVADTGTQMEAEGRAHHQPIGYNNGTIPFDNASGVNELARLVGSSVMDNGIPFADDTGWVLGGYSQGMIVLFDFCNQFLQDGQPLAHRRSTLKGILAYGNPCRKLNSVASWAVPWITKQGTHGLDPYKRFGLSGCFDADALNIPMVDVYREGDIFAENTDDQDGAIKSAVYEAVARSDWTSNPYSIIANVAALFSTPFQEVWGIAQAIFSGIGFLADNPNPHYAPYDTSGGIAWTRGLLAA